MISLGIKKRTAIIIGLGAVLLCAIYLFGSRPLSTPLLRWTMFQVGEPLQADAHLIEFPDGQVFLVDVGYADGQVVALLKERNIRLIHKVIITHAHRDHYEGLIDLYRSGVKVVEVLFNQPPRDICNAEIPWGCNFSHVEMVRELIKNKGIPLVGASTGDRLYERGPTTLDVLFAHDGLSQPVGKTDINDTSVILKLTHAKHSVLFTGDLNTKLGSYLASSELDLSAMVLKVPHHGTESVAPNSFFDRVTDLKVAFVPAPQPLWVSERSQRVRSYFLERKIPTYVTGRDGHVVFETDGERFKIRKIFPVKEDSQGE